MSGSYDVIIVGGRVAGSTLAALLGNAGLRVLLLERVTFPADTLSTHVIYGDSFGVWERIGAWDKIEQLRVTKLAGIAWIRDGRPEIRGRFWSVRGHDYSLCIRRVLLDDLLFTHASNTPSVTAVSGARVTELLSNGARVTGVKYEVQDVSGFSKEMSATARLVAGCDGRRSFVAKTVQATEYMVVPPINFAFYTYVQDVDPGPDPEPMFEIWDSEPAGGTPMLARCDRGITMAIVYLPQAGFDGFRANKEENFWQKMDSDPRIGPRLHAGTQVMPVRGAGDFVNFLREPVGDGWVLVGDAGQHKDPIYGQGIGDAVRSAEHLADCLIESESSGSEWRSALATFRTKRDLDLVSNFQWMIQGRPAELTPEEFEVVMEELGDDPQRAEEFVNIFSHAVSGSEFFGRLHAAALLKKEPASFDTRRTRAS